MPYRTVKEARDSIPSLKNLSDKQVREFNKIFNSMVASGSKESEAIPIAISQAKKINKNMEDIKKNNSAMMHLLQAFQSLLSSDNSKESEEDAYEEDEYHEDLLEEAMEEYKNKDDYTRPMMKQFDEEEMIAIEPLYIKAGETDAHKEGITEVELRKMIDNFNKNIANIKGNIHHKMMVDGYRPIRAWINECDCYIGDTLVPEGQPIVKVQFTDRFLWDKRKKGELKGVSIGATGKRVPNPNYVGE